MPNLRRVRDVQLLKSVGLSNVAIGSRLGISESTVRRDLTFYKNHKSEPKPEYVPHEHVELMDPFSNELVEIDERIALLIQSLWYRGVQTIFCCEGSPATTMTNNGGYERAAYILMVRDEKSMDLTRSILSDYIVFKHGYASYWHISVEKYQGLNRLCMRFPHNQIDKLTDFVSSLD